MSTHWDLRSPSKFRRRASSNVRFIVTLVTNGGLFARTRMIYHFYRPNRTPIRHFGVARMPLRLRSSYILHVSEAVISPRSNLSNLTARVCTHVHLLSRLHLDFHVREIPGSLQFQIIQMLLLLLLLLLFTRATRYFTDTERNLLFLFSFFFLSFSCC
jgi:hypothetical protein